MATSPQTSATSYFLRMKQEGRWNHLRAQQRPGPALPVLKFAPKEDLAWEEARRAEAHRELESDLPLHADLWHCGSAANEAKEFFKMLQRGVSDHATLRSDIAISASQMEDMNRWKERNPRVASSLERMIAHREKVLAAFDALVNGAVEKNSTEQWPKSLRAFRQPSGPVLSRMLRHNRRVGQESIRTP